MNYLKEELYTLVKKEPHIFEFIQKGSLDGIWYWDLEKPENEWMSDRFWETFGIEPSQKKHLSSEWQSIIFPEDLKTAIENFTQHCKDPDHPYDQIVRYRHSDGSTVWVRCRGIAIRDKSGKPIRMLGAHNDVTHLKTTEEMLEKSNQNLTLFARAATHDLKAPLRTLSTLLNKIKIHFNDHMDEKSGQYFHYAENATERMTTLVTDLFNFSVLGDNGIELKEIKISNLVKSVEDMLQFDINKNNVRIDIKNDASIICDETIIRQLMQNLINNSIKYRSKNKPPHIVINSEDIGSFWKVSIEDNGIGIDPKYHEKIFGLFQRLHRWEEYEGSGLGLSLCQRAVEYHGGKIWLKSEVDKGSKFYFTIKKSEIHG